MWCVPTLTPEYIERMEDVLALYERPYDPSEPVVCLDERPIQLLDSSRSGRSLAPGKIACEDYEYVRCGTANVFCAVEALAGRHNTKATVNRKAPAFAKIISEIAHRYRRAETIHLVVDNLNTHCLKSLTTHFGEKRGVKIWHRFIVHYTPQHGSWLNQAEIEISLFSRGCLGGDRIPTFRKLTRRTDAWCARMNADRTTICWGFTVKKARSKFHYKRSIFRRSKY